MGDKIEPIDEASMNYSESDNTGAEEKSPIPMEDSISGDTMTETINSSLSKENDFVAMFDHKRIELDKIQQDLNELMDRLNNFIAESQEDLCESEEDVMNNQYNVEDMSEKQDGPQEKELIKQKPWNGLSKEDIYTCDGLNPPEANWDVLAPFIQNVVGDLKKIRNLNQMTNSVLKRIRNVTSTDDKVTDSL